MKAVFIIIYFVTFSFSTFYAQDGKELKREIDKALAYEVDIDTAKMTGWVIGCIDNDSAWVWGYGRLSKTNPAPPDKNTVFEIGGITKAFTATIAQLMADQGLLNIDTTLNTYLKSEQQFVMGNRITVLQLLTHTSGLPKLPDGFGADEKDQKQPYRDYTEEYLFEYLQAIDSSEITAGKYMYSHLNYAILEKIIANAGGIEAFKQLEKPLKDTSLTYIQGYNPAQLPVPNWLFEETFKYSVGMKANINMMMDFVKLNLGIKDTINHSVLRGGQEPLFKTQIDTRTSIGKAWHVYQYKKRPQICLQTGSTNGQSALVAFVPETKTGVVIMANNRLVQAKLGMLVLKMLNYNWKR
jgi:CubicO group peptidase (beta-lactamase class C family)